MLNFSRSIVIELKETSMNKYCEKCVLMENPCKNCKITMTQLFLSECNKYQEYLEYKDNISGKYCNNCGRKIKSEYFIDFRR